MWFHYREVLLVRVLLLVTPLPKDIIRLIVDYCLDLERYDDACEVSRQFNDWLHITPNALIKVNQVKQAYRLKAICIRDGLLPETDMNNAEEDKLTEKLCKCIKAHRKMYETRRQYYYKNKPLEDYFMNDNIRNNIVAKLEHDRKVHKDLEEICNEILARYQDFL